MTWAGAAASAGGVLIALMSWPAINLGDSEKRSSRPLWAASLAVLAAGVVFAFHQATTWRAAMGAGMGAGPTYQWLAWDTGAGIILGLGAITGTISCPFVPWGHY